MIIAMMDPTKKHNESTACWHGIALYLLFVFCLGPDDGLIKPKHVDKAYEIKYELCFDRRYIKLSHSGRRSLQLNRDYTRNKTVFVRCDWVLFLPEYCGVSLPLQFHGWSTSETQKFSNNLGVTSIL
jgi:hypothetical protein